MGHVDKKKEKWFLVEDISTWIREQTSNPSDGLKDGQRISRHDLDAIWRAIERSRRVAINVSEDFRQLQQEKLSG
jgi:hypothetical protein